MMIQTQRVTSGIKGLDPLIEGGFPKGRSILVTGEPGTGKSIFALQFLAEGLARGEKCIFVTADEGPLDVLEQAASMGWDFERHAEQKDLSILNAGTYLSSLPGAGRERQFDIQKAVTTWRPSLTSLAPSDWFWIPPGRLSCCATSPHVSKIKPAC